MSNNLFICEVCGGVYPDTCPTCPDRGNGRGVTVKHIKDALRACSTNPEISKCREHFGRHIATLRKAKGDANVMATQIENLVAYRRNVTRWHGPNTKGAN